MLRKIFISLICAASSIQDNNRLIDDALSILHEYSQISDAVLSELNTAIISKNESKYIGRDIALSEIDQGHKIYLKNFTIYLKKFKKIYLENFSSFNHNHAKENKDKKLILIYRNPSLDQFKNFFYTLGFVVSHASHLLFFLFQNRLNIERVEIHTDRIKICATASNVNVILNSYEEQAPLPLAIHLIIERVVSLYDRDHKSQSTTRDPGDTVTRAIKTTINQVISSFSNVSIFEGTIATIESGSTKAEVGSLNVEPTQSSSTSAPVQTACSYWLVSNSSNT